MMQSPEISSREQENEKDEKKKRGKSELCRFSHADRCMLTCAPLAAYWGQGLSQEFLDGAFKGLFSKRKIARELLPLLKPKVERKPCEGKEGKSEKTCDELGEELLIAGRRDDVDEVSCR